MSATLWQGESTLTSAVPSDGDIGRGKAQGGFPRRIDGQKGNIPVLATGVSHHFTRGRIGNEFGADAPARRQPMAELDGDARWLSCLPRDGPRTALPRLMAKRSRDGLLCDIADSCGG